MAVSLLLVAIAVSNALWLARDRRPVDQDQSRYMLMVRDHAEDLQAPSMDGVRRAILGSHPTHPHLLPLLAAIPFWVTGRSVDAAYFSNTLFFLGTVWVVYRIASRFGSRRAGLIAAFVASGLPLLSVLSRYFLAETAATFFVALTALALARAETFTRERWTVGAGLALGAALLVKWTSLVFAAPLVAAAIWAPLHRGRVTHRVLSFGYGALAACGVALPWYLTHWARVVQFKTFNQHAGIWVASGPGLGQLVDYVQAFGRQTGWPLTLVVCCGLVVCVVQRRWVVLGWVFVPLATFSFLEGNFSPRHLLPAYPALAVAAGLGMDAIKPAPVGRLVRGVVLLVAFSSGLHAAWGAAEPSRWAAIGSLPALGLARAPDPRDWRFDELLSAVERDWADRRPSRPARVAVVPGNFPFRPQGFEYLAREAFPQVQIEGVPFFIPRTSPVHRHLDPLRILGMDYLLVRSGDSTGNSNDALRFGNGLRRFLNWSRSAGASLLTPIAQVPLAGGVSSEAMRVERPPLGDALLWFLDFSHELDPDDPSIVTILREGIGGRGETPSSWRQMAHALEEPTEGELRDLADVLAVAWPKRLLAEFYRDRGDWAAAAAAYRRVGPGKPYSCSPLSWAGDAYAQGGRWAEAVASYTTGLEDEPDCFSVHERMARALHETGDAEAARLEEEMSATAGRLEDGGETPVFRQQLGDLAFAAGRPMEAGHHYRMALDIAPGYAPAKAALEVLDALAADR